LPDIGVPRSKFVTFAARSNQSYADGKFLSCLCFQLYELQFSYCLVLAMLTQNGWPWVIMCEIFSIENGDCMGKGRLEAFSDAIIAIIITIMVLEMRVPHGIDFIALRPMLPVFLSYVLSFIYLSIYWNNHHHMLHVTDHVTGGILWANLHLLFWLSLIPFTTAWMGENHFASGPTALYGIVLLMAAIAYFILQKTIIRSQGQGSRLAAAVGNDLKGKISPICYLLAIPSAFISPWISDALYVSVALMWLIPDRRIERTISAREGR
jgi:uncharacterized membrane protein